jgi:hypothetical protein
LSSESISELSSLTKIQVQTIKMQNAMARGEINMENILKMRNPLGISRGTHYRILGQARRNIRRSLFTVATAAQMGLVKPDDVQRLISMVSTIPEGIDPQKLEELKAIVGALADRIVML